MSEKPIDKFETQLESLIEGAFARLFRRTINARDVAVLIVREMENHLLDPTDEDPRPIAPDTYIIYLNDKTIKNFLNTYPDLSRRLSQLIVDLSTQSGYRLHTRPTIKLLADSQLSGHKAIITADHGVHSGVSTEAMHPIDVQEQKKTVHNPSLQIGDDQTIKLKKSTINIGREPDNDIVIDDAYISRHHLQLRKRSGAYTLFDVDSRGGTKVNNTPVREHRLQNGDVIHIGHTRIIYTDDTVIASNADTTQSLDPI